MACKHGQVIDSHCDYAGGSATCSYEATRRLMASTCCRSDAMEFGPWHTYDMSVRRWPRQAQTTAHSRRSGRGARHTGSEGAGKQRRRDDSRARARGRRPGTGECPDTDSARRAGHAICYRPLSPNSLAPAPTTHFAPYREGVLGLLHVAPRLCVLALLVALFTKVTQTARGTTPRVMNGCSSAPQGLPRQRRSGSPQKAWSRPP